MVMTIEDDDLDDDVEAWNSEQLRPHKLVNSLMTSEPVTHELTIS
ncbi:unnamed protein product [Brassica oleracea]